MKARAAVTVQLPDQAATVHLAARIAAALRPGDVVALSGPLGAGKTTLARAILAALGHDGEVPSPSFAIIELYEPPGVRLPVVHADFYRLADPAEAVEIGLDDYRQGAALIAEWPERAGGFADEAACLAIRLEVAAESVGEQRESVGEKRWAIVEAGADWVMRGPWLEL
jgi:tRNA threonylcarbamoyladenosine biosynthesis protein TsaE